MAHPAAHFPASSRIRDHAGISLGASPRAGLALYKTTQAWAAIEGRGMVYRPC
ncbi:MAG: hypothetical protein OTJ97_05895 [SAR202 cluster bacterium]|nr:hypothetical protein [SAR202 cluster bacterium]